MEDVLAEVERDERLARVLSVTVHAKSNCSGRAERTAEGDDAEEDSRHDPEVAFLGRPAEAHKTDGCTDGNGYGHDEAELGFVDAAISTSHVPNDYV